MDGGPGVALADDLDPAPAPEPWAALLPALDPTPIGWQRREWFLGEHGPKLFDRTGNIGPSLRWDGRIVGGWGPGHHWRHRVQVPRGLGSDVTTAAEAAAPRLTAVLSSVELSARTRGKMWLE